MDENNLSSFFLFLLSHFFLFHLIGFHLSSFSYFIFGNSSFSFFSFYAILYWQSGSGNGFVAGFPHSHHIYGVFPVNL